MVAEREVFRYLVGKVARVCLGGDEMTDFEPITVTLVAPVDIDDVERELRVLDRLRRFPAIQRACEAYVLAVEAEYERLAPPCDC